MNQDLALSSIAQTIDFGLDSGRIYVFYLGITTEGKIVMTSSKNHQCLFIFLQSPSEKTLTNEREHTLYRSGKEGC